MRTEAEIREAVELIGRSLDRMTRREPLNLLKPPGIAATTMYQLLCWILGDPSPTSALLDSLRKSEAQIKAAAKN